MDEQRADAGPHVGDAVGGPAPYLEVVGAVEPEDLQPPEAPHQLRDRRRRLVGDGDRDGVPVVGHHVHDRQVERARRVQRLPELALGGGALAQRHVGDLVAGGRQVRELGGAADVATGLGAADGGDALAARGARLGDDVPVAVAPVAGHLPPARRRVGARADRLLEDGQGCDAQPQHEGHVAVVREEPVATRTQEAGEGEQQRLVAGAGDLEEDLALLLQADLAVVDGPGDARQPEVFERLVDRNPVQLIHHRRVCHPPRVVRVQPGRCLAAGRGPPSRWRQRRQRRAEPDMNRVWPVPCSASTLRP